MLTKTARFSFPFLLICLFVLTLSKPSNAIEQRPRATFSFPVPTLSDDRKELSSIIVRLNDLDISMFARLQTDYVNINLPTPLKYGEHRIHIQALYKNGETTTLLQKKFQLSEQKPSVRKAAPNFKQANSFIDTTAGEISDESFIQQTTAKPTIRPEKSKTSDFESMLPLLRVDAKDSDSAENKSFIRAGDQSFEQQGLLFSNYRKKGLSAGISGSGQRYQAQVFALDDNLTETPTTRPVSQINKEQSVGALASFSPLTSPELFTISTTYLRGEKSETVTDIHNLYHEQTLYGGDNWNISFDSRLLNKSLSVKSEYARSEFVNRKDYSSEGYRKSSAWKTSAEWYNQSSGKKWLFQEWRLGAEVQEIGPEFWSLGNPNLSNDIYSEKLYFTGNYKDFNLSAELIKEQNNVESQSPKRQAELLNFNWYFTPSRLNTENPIWSLFGQPSFNGYAHFTERNKNDEDAQATDYGLDHQIDEYHISANFQKTNWNWSFQHSQTATEDNSSLTDGSSLALYESPSDSRNYLTGLTLGLQPSDSLYFNFLIQLNQLKEKQSGNKSSNLNFGVESRIQMVPDKWSLNVNYTITENENHFENQLSNNTLYRDQSINIQTELSMLKPKNASPGLNVFFKGSYLHQEETKTNEQDEHYQVLIGCSLYWNKKG